MRHALRHAVRHTLTSKTKTVKIFNMAVPEIPRCETIQNYRCTLCKETQVTVAICSNKGCHLKYCSKCLYTDKWPQKGFKCGLCFQYVDVCVYKSTN